MQIKNPEIFAQVEAIGDHYRSNIANRYTRRALSSMPLEAATWSLIEELTEKSANYRYQGYYPDELYTQILGMAKFIYMARRQLSPHLRQLVSLGTEKFSEADRVLRDMAVNNFDSNLKILADKLNELYVRVASLDREAAAKRGPIFEQMPELRELGRLLIE